MPVNEDERGQVSLLVPGRTVQLSFPEPMLGIQASLQSAIREWLGWGALRSWAAFLTMLAEDGRTGEMRWTMDRHLELLGVNERRRRDPAYRLKVSRQIEAWEAIEIAAWSRDGTFQCQKRVLTVNWKMHRGRGTPCEAIEMAISPILYDGIRRAENRLGSNWFPQSPGVARIDETKHPHALALGLVLPIRWRWDFGDGRDHCAMKGDTLLRAAGIPYERRRDARAWERLERELFILHGVEGVGAWVWDDDGRPSLQNVCRLYPPQFARDRTVHGIPPIERRPISTPHDGAALLAWRQGQAWTQEAAAALLGVSARTISRAEQSGDKRLPPSVSKALSRLSAERLSAPVALLPPPSAE